MGLHRWIFLGLGWGLTGVAGAWHHVGNGGDPLRLMWWSAREQAAFVVQRMHPDAFPRTSSQELRSWILERKDALAADILASPHVWIEDEELHCAMTRPFPAAPIELSWSTCRKATTTKSDAAKILIHESVHHLGVTDETFADEVAVTIWSAWSSGILDWQPILNPVGARSGASAVWDGSRMMIFGGLDPNTRISNGLLAFDPSLDAWTVLPSSDMQGRFGHHSFVTEDRLLIVYGGQTDIGSGEWQPSGDVLDLTTGISRKIPSQRPAGSVRSVRQTQTAVWTGTHLVSWGGAWTVDGTNWNPEGGIWDPHIRKWSEMSLKNAPTRWSGHSAVWTGREMIVWGGRPLPGAGTETNTGAIWNPETNQWRPVNALGAPSPRVGHVAVWTGEKMIIFGGTDRSGGIRATGGIYDPQTDQWETFSSELITQRTGMLTAWTGDELLIHGGRTREALFGAVVAFNPVSKAWRSLAVDSSPEAREYHTGVWTGLSLIVVGGLNAQGERLASGGIFYP
jgi:hypothetical protein